MPVENFVEPYINEDIKLIFAPVFYRLNKPSEKEAFNNLLAEKKALLIHDEINGQLQELIKCKNPSVRLKQNEYPQLIAQHLNGTNISDYGVWVYYPWNMRLVHLLDEDEFVQVRTNRNQYKITKEEQQFLQTKKIGIVGLSVGQSIALTMVMERICGEIRLADFDTAELSNLNRLRTGVQNLGMLKTIIAAREIMEIDPFINVKLFHEGLHKHNMDEFFTADGKLDLFVEVCDGIDIKIESRYKARELGIPVVMDTNDRGMLDIERFDLEPNRPVLHGLADGLDPDNIKNLSNEDKIPYILKMVGADTISTRLKASMMEVEQSINTWPQLASSVVLGGAITTDVCRRILLDQYRGSGRYYVDMDELVKDENSVKQSEYPQTYFGPAELTEYEMREALTNFNPKSIGISLKKDDLEEIVRAGIAAPSGGNVQPWKFLYAKEGLFIFHDAHLSHSLLDFDNLGSYLSIGAVIENISIKASAMGLAIITDYFPVAGNNKLTARISFKDSEKSVLASSLEPGIYVRVTNRDISVKEIISKEIYDKLSHSISLYDGAELHIIDDEHLMRELGNILASAEMLRILHPRGHFDTFENELRWEPKEIIEKADGLDVNSLGASKSELAALKIAADAEAISFLRDRKGGAAFTRMVKKSVALSSSLGIITMPEYSALNFLKGGQAVERVWIEANLAGLSFQPIAQLVFLFARLNHGNFGEMDALYKKEFEKLEAGFYKLLPGMLSKQPVFIFRLSQGGKPKVRSLRRPLESFFIYSDN